MTSYRFRTPVSHPADRGAAPPRYWRTDADGMIIERGPHVIHTGGRYDSHLLVPQVSP